MEKLITFAQDYKDLFWIIFTFVATMVSLLTFFNVNKSLRQNLYNKVIDEQIDLYTKILYLLSNSFSAFLLNLNLETLLKYNLIAHLVISGSVSSEGIFGNVYTSFIKQSEDGEPPELAKELQNLDVIKVEASKGTLSNEQQFPEDINSKNISEEGHLKESNEKLYDAQKISIIDMRGLLLQTKDLFTIYNGLNICGDNIYMPKKLKKVYDKFFLQFDNILSGTTMEILKREEAYFRDAVNTNASFEINFSALYNELIGKLNDLKPNYNKVKKVLKKLLKIDKY